MTIAGKFSRLPSLDGWRAISILLVLGQHSVRTGGFPPSLLPVFNHIFDGDLGVRFFFVISGFLITWLLAGEMDRTGRISLTHFYIRRALRILPVSLVFIGVLGLLQWTTPFHQSLAVWIANLTFTTNYVQPAWPSKHLWSLAVEEQFYLIWPAIFLFWGVPKKIRTLAAILAGVVLSAPVFRLLIFKGVFPAMLAPLFVTFSFFRYFDSLAVGCGCAILLAHHRQMLERRLLSRPVLVLICALVLILCPYVIPHSPMPARYSFTSSFGPTFQAFGFALLMLQSIILPTMAPYRALNWKWVCWIGVLSYSIYIWQQPFCAPPVFFGLEKAWWMSFPGWIFAIMAVAIASYYGLERPFFRLRAYFRPRD